MAENDVYRYRPALRDCLEGIAIENEHGVLYDTYWGIDDGGAHYVDRDAQDLALIGNLDDFEPARSGFAEYAPADRLEITSKHGLKVKRFIRTGAKPDLETMIGNACRNLDDAESELRAAEHRVAAARQDLATLEGQRNG